MHDIDEKVKAILERIDFLCRMQMELPTISRKIEINTLIGALKVIEGKSNG